MAIKASSKSHEVTRALIERKKTLTNPIRLHYSRSNYIYK